MELICPSCEARYQLPDGAIGEKGRQVSCMSCGHGWHAYPPLVLNDASRAAGISRNVGIPFGAGAGARAGAEAAVADADRDNAPKGVTPPLRNRPDPADEAAGVGAAGAAAVGVGVAGTAALAGREEQTSSARTQQLAEIREMLAEVQAEEQERADVPQPLADDAAPQAKDGAARLRAMSDPEDDMHAAVSGGDAPLAREPVDPLDERLKNKPRKPEKAKAVDVKAIRRKHDRKEKGRKRQNSPGTGSFLTGFLLVVIVVAVLIGLYVLHPAIIERLPGTAQALNEYVATVDSFRVSIAQTFDQLRRWATGG